MTAHSPPRTGCRYSRGLEAAPGGRRSSLRVAGSPRDRRLGGLCAFDRRQNEVALRDGYRVLSCYPIGTERVWVITEADRSITTILLPEEY
jgi:hypothetical protein